MSKQDKITPKNIDDTLDLTNEEKETTLNDVMLDFDPDYWVVNDYDYNETWD